MWVHKLLLASTALLSEGVFASPAEYGLESRGLTTGTSKCAGYKAGNVKNTPTGVTATLSLIGKGCAVYGEDLKELTLTVDYETDSRLHVKITDAKNKRYEVPTHHIPRPSGGKSNSKDSDFKFAFKSNPFSFSIKNKKTRETIFDTTGQPFIFEQQYIRLATALGSNDPNVYGLGEHTNTFRLPNKNFTRTLWNRDAYGVAPDTNLYGSHPVYFEHRKKGTHGVFLLNSNGMDVKIDKSVLEYNVIGGIVDLYFFSGPTPDEVARQYSEVAGKPTLPPYWGLGSHQCRYGYRDWIEVAEVIANYSAAAIPLETMWTDIDYMFSRWIFTLDPERFPLDKMRRIVSNLHANAQKYIMMVDPAVAAQENKGYATFDNGVKSDIFLKEKDGKLHKGVVWPGVTVFPDWYHPNAQSWWTNEFKRFFDPSTGVDIDGIWIDMNEPASFCAYPCNDPEQEAIDQKMPPVRRPVRDPPRPIPGFPETANIKAAEIKATKINARDSVVEKRAITEIDLIDPPYKIANAFGGLSEKTAHTDIIHADGNSEYDVHNLYGSAMSSATYEAALARRPNQRPFIITRSTFVGAGTQVGKWLGDNLSTWEHYVNSISGLLNYGSIFQIPLVGADICGFGGNTTSTLCARWTTLGAFYPFSRNHNGEDSISQEPYLWDIVASAARKTYRIRYELLDYFYTALQKQQLTGSPALKPLFFTFPSDTKTFGIDTQFFYGPALLVSPVTKENATDVKVYLPREAIWYDYQTQKAVASGSRTLSNIDFDEIPLFVKGGEIIARRAFGKDTPQTTKLVREKDFEILVFVDKKGEASGELFLDDGETLGAKGVTARFSYTRGKFSYKVTGSGPLRVKIATVTVVGKKKTAHKASWGPGASGSFPC